MYAPPPHTHIRAHAQGASSHAPPLTCEYPVDLVLGPAPLARPADDRVVKLAAERPGVCVWVCVCGRPHGWDAHPGLRRAGRPAAQPPFPSPPPAGGGAAAAGPPVVVPQPGVCLGVVAVVRPVAEPGVLLDKLEVGRDCVVPVAAAQAVLAALCVCVCVCVFVAFSVVVLGLAVAFPCAAGKLQARAARPLRAQRLSPAATAPHRTCRRAASPSRPGPLSICQTGRTRTRRSPRISPARRTTAAG